MAAVRRQGRIVSSTRSDPFVLVAKTKRASTENSTCHLFTLGHEYDREMSAEQSIHTVSSLTLKTIFCKVSYLTLEKQALFWETVLL